MIRGNLTGDDLLTPEDQREANVLLAIEGLLRLVAVLERPRTLQPQEQASLARSLKRAARIMELLI